MQFKFERSVLNNSILVAQSVKVGSVIVAAFLRFCKSHLQQLELFLHVGCLFKLFVGYKKV